MPSDKPKPQAKCWNPEKQKLTQGEAIRQALLRSAVAGKPMAYYQCAAGHYHITSKSPNWSSTR